MRGKGERDEEQRIGRESMSGEVGGGHITFLEVPGASIMVCYAYLNSFGSRT